MNSTMASGLKRVLVLGGSGFVGRALCEQWASRVGQGMDVEGPRLLVPSRRRERAKHLFMLPMVDVIEASVHDDHALARMLVGVDAVVNLIAILHGTRTQFEQVHVNLPQRLAQACIKAGVRRLVHVSALGVSTADPAQAPSDYLSSKTRGELALHAVRDDLALTVLRPSVIFGEHDRFLNLFAAMQTVAPVVPLAGASARFQPVWVDDVASALLQALSNPATAGQTYECVGPEVFTLAVLVSLAGRLSGHARPVWPMPDFVGRAQAAVLGLLPGEPLMSADNLDSMKVPNVATDHHPGLADLGIQAASVHQVAPTYLGGAPYQKDVHRNDWRAWRRR